MTTCTYSPGNGAVLAIGAPGRNNSVGAVYTCVCSAGVCGTLTALVLPGGVAGDLFGDALALNDEGTILAVGADGVAGGNGSVFLYACEAGVCGPTPASVLPAPSAPSDSGGIPLHFGRALSMGDDTGSLLLIGAPQLCCGESGRYSIGYAYLSVCTAGAVCGEIVVTLITLRSSRLLVLVCRCGTVNRGRRAGRVLWRRRCC